MYNRLLLLSAIFLVGLSIFVTNQKAHAQRPPICASGIGHLIWTGTQSKGVVPSLGESLNTLMGSPIKVAGDNVGIGRDNPSHRLDVDGSFRVTVNGEERLAIKERDPAQAQNNRGFLKPAYAQTTPQKWVELFGGAAYFLKRGTNSDIFLQLGDEKTDSSSIRSRGKEASIFLFDETNKGRVKVRYDKQNQSAIIQTFSGITEENRNVPTATLELKTGSTPGTTPKLKFWGGDTPSTQKLILEITEGE